MKDDRPLINDLHYIHGSETLKKFLTTSKYKTWKKQRASTGLLRRLISERINRHCLDLLIRLDASSTINFLSHTGLLIIIFLVIHHFQLSDLCIKLFHLFSISELSSCFVLPKTCDNFSFSSFFRVLI